MQLESAKQIAERVKAALAPFRERMRYWENSKKRKEVRS